MIYGDVLSFGGSGVLPKINVSGLLSTDSVVATMGSKTKVGKAYTRKSTRLPSGYTEVEYIESHGTEYINTNYAFSSEKERVAFKTNLSSIGDYRLGGTYTYPSYTHKKGMIIQTRATNTAEIGTLSWSIPNSITATNTDYEINLLANNGTATFTINNNTSTTSYSGTLITGLTYYIFGCNWSGSPSPAIGKLYYFKMWDGDTLVRDFVPCKNSLGEYGLYDLVTNAFFGKSGSGNFTGGNDVYETYFQVVVNDFGTWNVTATDSGVTKHLNVMVDTVREYDVDISDFS